MNEKITQAHLDRAAYVYVRQSTAHQVRDHVESNRRQYELQDRARELGFRTVEVIDEDLGLSGSGRMARPGFKRLLTAVCEEKVGAVLAMEASRLARNNRDWHHLVDMCCLTGALLVDYDGIYEPRLLNDRLLLGLKGTMSEFEMGILRQRAQEALRDIIQRGEVVHQPATGYVRTPDRRYEKHPDIRVQAAFDGLFAKFREVGSARQLLLWYHQEGILFPLNQPGSDGHVVTWKLPAKSQILSILHNPTYAGAYVHGRRRTVTQVIDGRGEIKRDNVVPQEDWPVLIRDHHEGYITWEQYTSNKEQLANNARGGSGARSGAARCGHAILAGLLRCGRCGRGMMVAYKNGKRARYYCKRDDPAEGTEWCISIGSGKVDEAVTAQVLKALQRAGVTASLDALTAISARQDEARRQVQLSMERAQYEADRVRRQYDNVDPENRQVAAVLEARWEEKLTEVAAMKRRLEEFDASVEEITSEERELLLNLGRDLELLWHHPNAPFELKKRILRTVLKQIVVNLRDEPREVVLHLHWEGGAHTELRVPRLRRGENGRETPREVVELISDLASMCDDIQLAAVLNRLRYRTGIGLSWTEARTRQVRRNLKIPAFDPSQPRSWLTLREAARHLEVTEHTVRKLIDQKILLGRQVIRHAPWVIETSSLELPEVRNAVATLKSRGRLPRARSAEGQRPLFSTT